MRKLENQELVDQHGDPPPAALHSRPSALDLIAARPELFARQGSVCASWRRVGPKTYGPYYCLRYRDGGVSRSLYLGRQTPLVECVRERLRTLQAPLLQRRVFDQLRGRIRQALRLDRCQVAAQLVPLGLRLKGFEIRGWRTSPLTPLIRWRGIGSGHRPEAGRGGLSRFSWRAPTRQRWSATKMGLSPSKQPTAKPFRVPRVRQVRFILTGRAVKWFRQNRPQPPRLPVARLETFLDARDARRCTPHAPRSEYKQCDSDTS